jgi:hypothetical protein
LAASSSLSLFRWLVTSFDFFRFAFLECERLRLRGKGQKQRKLFFAPPHGAIRLIVLLASHVNHSPPSGPATFPHGALSVLGGIVGGPGFGSDENSVTTPAGVTRPMRSGMLKSYASREQENR